MVVELNTTSPTSLSAVFCFGESLQVWIELVIGFIGDGDRPENHLTEIARIIEGSRHHQRLDPACSDCDWHQVLNVIRRCHDQARLCPGGLVTNIRIEDRASAIEEPQCDVIPAESAAAIARMI